jgi:hypothetical protein
MSVLRLLRVDNGKGKIHCLEQPDFHHYERDVTHEVERLNPP